MALDKAPLIISGMQGMTWVNLDFDSRGGRFFQNLFPNSALIFATGGTARIFLPPNATA